MMTHYETLGVPRPATPEVIRTAFRKLVLLHHPDRSQSTESKTIFLAATEAYAVIGDPDQKREYDAYLLRAERRTAQDEAEWQARRQRREEAARTGRASRQAQTTARAASDLQDPPAKPRPERRLSELVTEMKRVYALGRPLDAERLAREVLGRSPRNPEAFATLGDIAAMRGDAAEALRMYGFAAQFDPKNPVYARRQEELHQKTTVRRVATGPRETTVETRTETALKGHWLAPFFGFVLAAVAVAYAGWPAEPPILPVVPAIATWTLSMFLGLFAGGLAVGAGLSGGALVDRFNPANGAANPAVILGGVAWINFWLAAFIYGVHLLIQDTRSPGATRLVTSVAGLTCLAMASAAAFGHVNPFEVLVWGGNIIYLGALCGWLFADALRG